MPSSPRTPRQRCHSEPVTDVTGVGIRPPCLPLRGRWQREALTEGLSKGIFRAPARGTFALGGKSTQKRRSNLRFENPFARLHLPRILTAFATRTLCPANFTEMLHCLCFSFRCRFRSEMQGCTILRLNAKAFTKPAAKGRHLPLPLRGKGAI